MTWRALTVAPPVHVHVAAGARTRLDAMKAWQVANNAAVVATLLLMLGAVLIGTGIEAVRA